MKKKPLLEKVTELEISQMKDLLSSGDIVETERGQENIYFENKGGAKFFCKCL